MYLSVRLRRRTLPLQTSSGMLLVGRAKRVPASRSPFIPVTRSRSRERRRATNYKLHVLAVYIYTTDARVTVLYLYRPIGSIAESHLLPSSSSAPFRVVPILSTSLSLPRKIRPTIFRGPSPFRRVESKAPLSRRVEADRLIYNRDTDQPCKLITLFSC